MRLLWRHGSELVAFADEKRNADTSIAFASITKEALSTSNTHLLFFYPNPGLNRHKSQIDSESASVRLTILFTEHFSSRSKYRLWIVVAGQTHVVAMRSFSPPPPSLHLRSSFHLLYILLFKYFRAFTLIWRTIDANHDNGGRPVIVVTGNNQFVPSWKG